MKNSEQLQKSNYLQQFQIGPMEGICFEREKKKIRMPLKKNVEFSDCIQRMMWILFRFPSLVYLPCNTEGRKPAEFRWLKMEKYST